jgi:hypothetical protein
MNMKLVQYSLAANLFRKSFTQREEQNKAFFGSSLIEIKIRKEVAHPQKAFSAV